MRDCLSAVKIYIRIENIFRIQCANPYCKFAMHQCRGFFFGPCIPIHNRMHGNRFPLLDYHVSWADFVVLVFIFQPLIHHEMKTARITTGWGKIHQFPAVCQYFSHPSSLANSLVIITKSASTCWQPGLERQKQSTREHVWDLILIPYTPHRIDILATLTLRDRTNDEYRSGPDTSTCGVYVCSCWLP